MAHRRRLRALAAQLHAEGAAAVESIEALSLLNVGKELERREMPSAATLREGWRQLASVVDDGWEKQLGLPTPQYVHLERVHYTDTAGVLARLKEDGVCVVRGCFSADEVEQAMSHVWEFVEGQGTGVDRHDVTTWTNDRWQPRTSLAPDRMASAGLHDGRGVHQSMASWYIRSRPKLKQLWASIYDTDDLICSFDGLVLCRPWGVDPSWRVKANGLHLDGGTARFGLHPMTGEPMTPAETGLPTDDYHYIQGVVNLVTTSPDSGGFTCVLGSHLAFETLEEEYWRDQQSANTTKRIVAEHPEIYAGKHIVPHMEGGGKIVILSRFVELSVSLTQKVSLFQTR